MLRKRVFEVLHHLCKNLRRKTLWNDTVWQIFLGLLQILFILKRCFRIKLLFNRKLKFSDLAILISNEPNIKNCAATKVKCLFYYLLKYVPTYKFPHCASPMFFLTRMVSLGLEHCAFWSRGKFVFWWPISWRNYNLSWESAYEFLTSIVSHLHT